MVSLLSLRSSAQAPAHTTPLRRRVPPDRPIDVPGPGRCLPAGCRRLALLGRVVTQRVHLREARGEVLEIRISKCSSGGNGSGKAGGGQSVGQTRNDPGAKKYPGPISRLGLWCRGADLNRRHTDFQSVALPTELPRLDNPSSQTNRTTSTTVSDDMSPIFDSTPVISPALPQHQVDGLGQTSLFGDLIAKWGR